MSLASDLIQRIQVGGQKLLSTATSSVGSASEFVRKNPITSAATATGGILAGVTAVQVIRKARKKSTKAKKSKPKARKAKPTTRRKVSKKKKSATKKRSKKGSKKIYKTKKGQPYIILPNGRARFISKSSASRRRKIKGGYY